MDVETIDSTYSQLQSESQQTETALTALAAKLQAASAAGNPDAREWMLDLKEIAIGIQNEQNQTSNLLQALHGFVQQVGQAPAQQFQPQYQQPAYQPPQYQQPGQQGGGMMQRFIGGGFGRAIASGAGFGIGDDLINKIF